MSFKSSARRGRFNQRGLGDPLQPLSRQQQDIIKFLDRERRQHKELGQEMIASLKGVANTETENARIINNIDNEIYKTKYNAIKVKGEREVEALQQKAKEFEDASDFWMDFSGTGARNLGLAAAGFHEAAEVYRGTNLYDQEQHLIKKYSIDGANLERIAVRESLIQERQLLSDTEKSKGGLSDEDKLRAEALDEQIKEQNIAIQKALKDRRRNSNRELARLHLSGFKDNPDAFYKDALVQWDKLIDSKQGKSISHDLLPKFFEAYAKEYLSQRGLSLKTDEAQNFIRAFTDQGTQVYGKFEGKIDFNRTQEVIQNDVKTIRGAANDIDVENAVGDLILNIKAGTFRDDKNGSYYRFNGDLADAAYQAFTILAQHPKVTKEDLDRWLDSNVVGENISYRDKLSKRFDLDNTLYEKFAEAKHNHTQREDRLKKARESDWYETNIGSQYDPDGDGVLDNSNEEDRLNLQQQLRFAKSKGYTDSVEKIAALLTYDKNSTVPSQTQFKLDTAVKNQDWKWFNSIYTSGELSSTEKKQYQGLNRALSEITNLENKLKTPVDQTIVGILGREQIVGTVDRNRTSAIEFASNQILNRYIDSTVSNKTRLEKGEVTYDQLLQEAINSVTEEMTSDKGVWKVVGVNDTGNAKGKAYFDFFDDAKINAATDRTKDMDINTLKTTLLNNPIKDKASYDVIINERKVLGDSTIASIIKDIEDGRGVMIPERAHLIANHFKGVTIDGSPVTAKKVINDILAKQGFKSRIGPSAKEVLDNSGGSSAGKSENYCSAELLYENLKEFNAVPITQEMRVNLLRNDDEIIKYLNDNGLVEGTDYTVSREPSATGFFKGLSDHYDHITPTSRRGLYNLLQKYKSLGYEIVLNGTLEDFTNCNFVRSK